MNKCDDIFKLDEGTSIDTGVDKKSAERDKRILSGAAVIAILGIILLGANPPTISSQTRVVSSPVTQTTNCGKYYLSNTEYAWAQQILDEQYRIRHDKFVVAMAQGLVDEKAERSHLGCPIPSHR